MPCPHPGCLTRARSAGQERQVSCWPWALERPGRTKNFRQNRPTRCCCPQPGLPLTALRRGHPAQDSRPTVPGPEGSKLGRLPSPREREGGEDGPVGSRALRPPILRRSCPASAAGAPPGGPGVAPGGVVAQPVSTHADEGQSLGSPGGEGHMTGEVAALDPWRPGWRRNVRQRPPWRWALDGSRRTPSSPHAGPSRG